MFLLKSFMSSIYWIISFETELGTHFAVFKILNALLKRNVLCFEPRFLLFRLFSINFHFYFRLFSLPNLVEAFVLDWLL